MIGPSKTQGRLQQDDRKGKRRRNLPAMRAREKHWAGHKILRTMKGPECYISSPEPHTLWILSRWSAVSHKSLPRIGGQCASVEDSFPHGQPLQEMWFNPWVRKIPWRRKWQLTLVFLPENFTNRGILWAIVPGLAKSQTWLKRLSRRRKCLFGKESVNSWLFFTIRKLWLKKIS